MSVNANEPDWRRRRPQSPGVAPRRRERGDRAEARAHEAALRGRSSKRQARLERGDELLGEEARVRSASGVLVSRFERLRQRDHEGLDLEAVDEIVEDGAQGRVAQVVLAVVDDEERVAARTPEARGDVEEDPPRPAERGARDDDLVDRARPRLRIRGRPLRRFVPGDVTDRVRAERIVGAVRIPADPRSGAPRRLEPPRACTRRASPRGARASGATGPFRRDGETAATTAGRRPSASAARPRPRRDRRT